jgi:hypothetical protein
MGPLTVARQLILVNSVTVTVHDGTVTVALIIVNLPERAS